MLVNCCFALDDLFPPKAHHLSYSFQFNFFIHNHTSLPSDWFGLLSLSRHLSLSGHSSHQQAGFWQFCITNHHILLLSFHVWTDTFLLMVFGILLKHICFLLRCLFLFYNNMVNVFYWLLLHINIFYNRVGLLVVSILPFTSTSLSSGLNCFLQFGQHL